MSLLGCGEGGSRGVRNDAFEVDASAGMLGGCAEPGAAADPLPVIGRFVDGPGRPALVVDGP